MSLLLLFKGAGGGTPTIVGTSSNTLAPATLIATGGSNLPTPISIAENTALNYYIGTPIFAYSISGPDASQFLIFEDINSGELLLRFSGTNARNFETPADVGGNNVYNITLTDEFDYSTDYTITVTDVVEGGVYIYKGIRTRAQVYKGIKTTPAPYKGILGLFP